MGKPSLLLAPHRTKIRHVSLEDSSADVPKQKIYDDFIKITGLQRLQSDFQF